MRTFFFRLIVAGGLAVAGLPLLAIARGMISLLRMPAAPSGGAWIGSILAFAALFCGVVFFAYAVKYYIATVLALTLAFLSRWRNGNGSDSPAAEANGHPHGLVRIRGNGNGNGAVLPPAGYQPFVSIHIATYNEQRVIGRLLEACAGLDYENYEVIVVDDSTDGSVEILRRWEKLPRFTVIHRPNRSGFKGGALQEALLRMNPRTDYVLVLDADAVPFRDVIQRFLPFFYSLAGNGSAVLENGIAAVQSYQWHVLNKSENWLTEAVRVEYAGSYMAERPLQQMTGAMRMVAGTGYMIRADLLRRLGWGRSITEDWELTLRLYELGYTVAYTPYAETPAECVATFPRLVRQRMRWAEGHTYNVRKYFWRILRAPAITVAEKIEFLFFAPYYLQALVFLIGTVTWLTAELILKSRVPEWTALLGWSLLFSNLLSLPLMNMGGLLLEEAPPRDFHGLVGAFGLSLGLVPFQAWAALKGLVEAREGHWHRTPKTGRITDPVDHLHRLKRLQRWLVRSRESPSHSDKRAAATAIRRPTPRLGWIVLTSLLIAITAIGVRALSAPVVYANPDQLFLRNATSSANATDQTLDVEGSLLATKAFSNGATFTWLSATSYSSGSVAAGNYTFKLDWIANTCGTGGSACTITVTWGYCASGCSSLQPASATFTFTLNSGSGQLGTVSQTVSGSAISLSGCPCNFYLSISSASGVSSAWTLGYDGAIGTLCSLNQCDDTNISTPTLPVPEHLLALALLAPLIPGLAGVVARRRR